MPVADSILWSPAVGGAHGPAPLMFFAQHTLRKIHDRLATVPNGRGIGLLAGRRYTDSRSGAQFVIIDGALPLPVLSSEDEATDALAQGLGSAAQGIEVVGWYRSHSFSDAALTPSDVEAQSELLGDRGAGAAGSIVVVVAAGAEAGAVFRHSTSPAWPVEALPLYEWLAEPARSDGPKPTMLTWRNYHAAEPVARVGAPLPAPVTERISSNRAVLMPDVDPEEVDPAVMVAPAPQPRPNRLLKPAVYVACALGGAVLVAALSAIISSGDASRPSRGAGANGSGGEPGSAGYPGGMLDRRADTLGRAGAAGAGRGAYRAAILHPRPDTLALAVAAFEDRARMFDNKQMICAGLQRGLQQVEDNWLSYNIARRETLAPFDGQREERDRSLYADVRSVERRFERSGCPRP